MRVRRTVVALAAIATLVTSASVLAATPATAALPPLTRVALTDADNGTEITLRPNTLVTVNLSPPSFASFVWPVPRSDNPASVALLSGRRTPSGGVQAAYVTRRPGTATISAIAVCNAPPNFVCPAIAITWQVTIHVR